MTMMDDTTTPRRGHPGSILWMPPRWHAALISVFLLVCVAGAFWLQPAEWGALRTAAAGVLVGLGSYLCLFVNRIMMA